MTNDTLAAIQQSDVFNHTRIINGMGISLSISRILLFLSRFVQHPKENKFSLIHLGWLVIAFLWIIQFWWDYLFDSRLYTIDTIKYIADLCYVFGMYFMCVILTPDHIAEYVDYDDYFESRKKWFFSILIILNFLQSMEEVIVNIRDFDIFGIMYWIIVSIIEAAIILIALKFKARKLQYLLIFLTMCLVAISFCLD